MATVNVYDGFSIVRNVATRMDREASKSDAVQHVWTFDFSGCTREQVAALATRDLVINLQNRIRRGKAVPKSGSTIKVVDVARGITMADPVASFEALLAAGDPRALEVLKRQSARK